MDFRQNKTMFVNTLSKILSKASMFLYRKEFFMGANWIVTAVVIVYLIAMLFIGWYSSTKINSNTDFMVAGRRLGPFLMAGTLAATEIGGGSSLGVVQNGMSGYGLSAAWYIITM